MRKAFYAELNRAFVPYMEGEGFRLANMGAIRADAFGARFDMPMVRIREGRLDLLTLSMLPQMPGSLYTYFHCAAVPEGLKFEDLEGVDGMAFLQPPLHQTFFVVTPPVRSSWFRRKASRPYRVEDETITGDALQNTVTAEVARFIADMQVFETRACEALRRSGIWRIIIKDKAILADALIPANSQEFQTLIGRFQAG